MKVESGYITVFTCFDVANAIEISGIRRLLDQQPQQTRLQLSRPAPTYMQYREPPLRVDVGKKRMVVGKHGFDATVAAKVFAFGAISIEFRFPVKGSLASVSSLSVELERNKAALTKEALGYVEKLVEEIGPSITNPNSDRQAGSLIVYELKEFSGKVDGKAIQTASPELAAILAADSGDLSEGFVKDVLDNSFSYYENDFIATYSDSALLIEDGDARDVLDVLEFALVQSVELRLFDSLLDKELEKAYDSVHKSRWLFSDSQKERDEVAEIRLEVSEVVEKIENSLKLVGDAYLARVFGLTTDSLHLAEWRGGVSQKLDSLEKVYQVLDDKVQARRDLFFWTLLTALEVIAVAFFAIEAFNLLRP